MSVDKRAGVEKKNTQKYYEFSVQLRFATQLHLQYGSNLVEIWFSTATLFCLQVAIA